jgi:competence protein ComEA
MKETSHKKEDGTLKTPGLISLLCVVSLSLVLATGIAFGQTGGGAKISLNKATAAQLSKVSGLNANLAKAIVEFRQKNGPFKKVDDLAKVPGMTKEIITKAGIQVDSKGDVVAPAPKGGGDDDEEGPSLKPSKC